MSRITPVSAKKRKLEDAMRGKTTKPRKRTKKQKRYHSSSSEDEQEEDVGFAPVNLGDSDDQAAPVAKPVKEQKLAKNGSSESTSKKSRKTSKKVEQPPESSADEEEVGSDASDQDEENDQAGNNSDMSDDSDAESKSTSRKTTKPKSKRNDPTAFSISISKILSTKVPSKSADPLLAHSRDVAQARAAESSSRLEAKAASKLRAEKIAALQKGRIRDPSGIERGIAGQVAREEKDLRRIAQRGVVQLFNAFRAAHVKAEAARKEERMKGTIGMGERERKAVEMGKGGFLERIAGGRKSTATEG
ncbi:pre-60S ribosomal particles component [Neophaeococcomyces mojaviensis]|uniref:Pre-60S ribosomal particles component n=1 Tax=Neophaeococcomyces mojaviensis TaxID=3383035 RepID=A0ACC3A888_9EURO|nr:pre-60S ribosomal particles component [Knufia sp. JES_112]